MNRFTNFFESREKVLSIYFTAGYPRLDDTLPILHALQEAGVDFIEIGIPFSDPLADGPTIQQSGNQALQNGMTLKYLFNQLEGARETITVPLVLMGYLNTVLRFGMERFLQRCVDVGIDGVIIPDLPFEHFNDKYRLLFEAYNVSNIFLITPQTPATRVQMLDEASTAFLYMVSSAAVTGATSGLNQFKLDYFERVAAMNLKTPRVVGFGISDNASYRQACSFASGVIIGSSYIREIATSTDFTTDTKRFVNNIKHSTT